MNAVRARLEAPRRTLRSFRLPLHVPRFVVLLLLAACARPTHREAPNLHAMPTESITGDVVWSGEVVVDRIVVVRTGARLTIRPGTRVRFRRIDWDADGVGDAEITVEGSLEAVGTPDAPIRFESAEADPRPGDWKYLHINFAQGARLAYASVRHAFSGIQVHYSRAEIRRCEFAENGDGIRFSTADLLVVDSWIHHNTNGIRYEERDHPARIEGNEISDNDVGIFAVTRCEDRSTFRGNNLRRNGYAIKLGWDQSQDLTFPENHWGTARIGEVRRKILDHRIDPRLGRVTLEPILLTPAPVFVPPFPGSIP